MSEVLNVSATRKWRNIFLLILAMTGIGLLVILGIELWRRRVREQASTTARLPIIAPLTVEGLTEAEAAARLEEGQDNSIQRQQRRARQEIIRESIFTIFNLNLVGLAFVQGLMGRWLDTLMTIGIMFANVGANLFQEEFARFRLRTIQEETRPQATVIRDGKIRSIDPGKIVLGDVLAVGPGDEIMVDGVVVGEGDMFVDESLLSGDSSRVQKQPGEQIYAGSICVGGHAVFEAEKVGDQRHIAKQLEQEEDARVELTPIERILNHVMRIVLGIVIILAALLMMRYYQKDAFALEEVYLDAINVIFNVAPAGLFFMVVLTYVAATADLGQLGALVHQSRSVESLAQLDILCIAKAGILTGGRVEILPLSAEEPPPLAEPRIRQVLGDYAHSVSTRNLTTRAMAATFEGSKRPVQDEATHFSIYGWSALVFDEDDLRGVYVLGDSTVLQALLTKQGDEAEKESGGSLVQTLGGKVTSLTRPFGRLLGRNKTDTPSPTSPRNQAEALKLPPADGGTEGGERAPIKSEGKPPDVEAPDEGEKGGVFGRFRRRVGRLVQRKEAEPASPEIADESPIEETLLTFAYAPEVASIQYDGRDPVLPRNLIPLCQLSYQEQMRPETIKAVRDFADRGVEIKVFTADTPAKTVDMLKQAEFGREDGTGIPTISGPDLAALNPADLSQVAQDNTVFGRMLPQQMMQIVRALQASGYAVGVVGDGVSDLPAMHQANIAISQRSSSPAAFTQADIVLLEDSPTVLSRVVDKGQRIVNGLVDVLKLYLVQVFYLLLLIVAVPLIAGGFPYTSAQGGMIALVTLTLPAVGLSIWATPGVLPTANLGRLLAHFVIPAATTMAITALIVYMIFLQRGAKMAYAQIALSHALVAMGLLLVLFIKPPLRFSRGRLPRAQVGDLRSILIVMVGVLLWLGITYIPLARKLLKVEPLEEPSHYLIVGVAALAWAFAVQFLWLVIPLQRRVRARVLGKTE